MSWFKIYMICVTISAIVAIIGLALDLTTEALFGKTEWTDRAQAITAIGAVIFGILVIGGSLCGLVAMTWSLT